MFYAFLLRRRGDRISPRFEFARVEKEGKGDATIRRSPLSCKFYQRIIKASEIQREQTPRRRTVCGARVTSGGCLPSECLRPGGSNVYGTLVEISVWRTISLRTWGYENLPELDIAAQQKCLSSRRELSSTNVPKLSEGRACNHASDRHSMRPHQRLRRSVYATGDTAHATRSAELSKSGSVTL
ncbi:hypothetical protein EVAR_102801_1 [Eumeta japonica]|uniref:Uncharacterized protein n=1 Tax=Eumeta variegata TaxID=151549 RepID=A0A4C1THZ3_EUMVA|nr:hypothetical protein EVAR_102801_1 [Eumeta japonica]